MKNCTYIFVLQSVAQNRVIFWITTRNQRLREGRRLLRFVSTSRRAIFWITLICATFVAADKI